MSKLFKEESGFGVTELIVTLAIIVVLGTAGWLVYKKEHKSVANPSINTNISQNSGHNLIKFSELDVQISVPSTLSDLFYKVINVDYSQQGKADLGTDPTAYLSTKTFENLESGKCSIASASVEKGTVPPLGFLTKTPGTYPTKPTLDNSTGNLVKQFSTFYISYRSAGMPCFSEAKDIAQVQTLNTELSNALSTIQLMQ